MSYAENTTVPVAKTRGEIEALVEKYGATRFASGWMDDTKAAINFVAKGRLVRFVLPLPTRDDARVLAKKGLRYTWHSPTEKQIDDKLAAEQRRRWRCLLLAMKAKLEVVETGIETFEQAFLANIVTTDNMTIYERIKLDESDIRMLPAMPDEVPHG